MRSFSRLLRGGLIAITLATFLGDSNSCVAADTFDFAAVYADVNGEYGWGYVNDPDFGATTTNWIGPGNRLYPNEATDVVNITTPTNGLTIKLYSQTNRGSIAPLDVTLGVLNLNAGPNGYYHIDPYPDPTGALVDLDFLDNLNNSFGQAQINILGNDAGNDVISCVVEIANSLDITGGKLLISGTVAGNQLIVDSSSLTLTAANLQTSTVLRSGTLNVSSEGNLGLDLKRGSIDFQGGTLHASGPGLAASQSLSVEAAGGTLSIDPGTTLTLYGPVAAINGVLHVVGGGTLELANSSAYGGVLTVDSSTLLISNNIALGTTGGFVLSPSTLSLNSSTLRTTASFSSNAQRITLSGSSLIDVGGGTTLTVGGVIDGTGGLTKSGDGILFLPSTNTFTGGVTVNAGTLQIQDASALGDPANSIAINGATLSAVGFVTTNRSIHINGATIDVDDVGNGGRLNITSQISGGGGLTKTGSGTLVLSSANSFKSNLAINGGAVSISADNALGDVANSLSFDGGVLHVIQGFTTGRPLLLDTGGGTVEVEGNGTTLRLSGLISGPGDLTVNANENAVAVTNINNAFSNTNIVSGTLRIADDSALGLGALRFSGVGYSGVLNTTADVVMSRSIYLVASASTFDIDTGTVLTISGPVQGGALVKVGLGELVFTDADNSYGSTTINAGSLRAGATNTIPGGSAVRVAAGASFNLGGFSQSIGSLTGAGNVTTTGAVGFDTLKVGNDTSSPPAFSGVISDAAGGRMLALTKVGTGTLTLSGINTYTGPTTVNGGTLAVTGSIAASSLTTVNSGGTLDFIGVAHTPGFVNNGSVSFSAGPTTVDGNVTNNGNFKTTNAAASFTGTFTNNGIFNSDPSTQNFQNLTIGANGALVGGLGDIFNVRGNLINNSTQNAVWDTHLSQIGFNASGQHQINWTGTEQGRGNSGFINNFATGSFVLPSGASLATSGGGALYTRVLQLADGIPQIASITGAGLSFHYNPGSPQNAYLNFQTYALPSGFVISPAAAPADVNAVWNGTTGNWSDATRWSGGVAPVNPSNSVTLYDATINAGTVTLDQTIGYIQKLNLGSGGTLTGPNSLTPWDTFTWGTVGNTNTSTINGGAVVNANGDLTIVGDSARNLDNATINNHAGYNSTWAAGNSDVNFSNGATFNNFGAFIVQNNRGLGHNGGTGTFNNFGTFTKNTGSGTTNIGTSSFVYNNLGSISVLTGTLEFDTPLNGPTTASASISGGASLVLADGLTTFAGAVTNSGSLSVGDAIGAANSAVFRLQVNNQINNSSNLTVKSDGLLDVNGLSETVGALAVTSGNVSIGAGTLMPSSLSMTGGAISSTGSGKLQLGGNVTATSDGSDNPGAIRATVDLYGVTRTFNVSRGSGVTDLLVSGNVGNGGLIETGSGILTLTGTNTYSGGTQLQSGTLNINAPSAIGTGPFTVSGSTTIDNASAGAVTLTTNNVQSWLGSFTFAGTQSLNFGTGAVTLNVNPTVTVAANTLTVGPIGNGTGNSLAKAGAGTLVVFGGASYTGATTVNAGTLTIDSGPFASSASAVAAAATMNFVHGANAGNGTFANSFSMSSTVTGGLIQFSDTGTTAGYGNYTNNGFSVVDQHSNFSGNGGQIVFNSGATAGNANIVNNGATYRYGGTTGGQTFFNNGSTAGNATITTQGGRDPISGGPAAGGLTLFSGNATAGAATLITNAGSLGGLPGFTEFKDTANGGTANITINSATYNEFLDYASAAGATITTHGVYSALYFVGNATAGTAMVTTNVDGLTDFENNATAGYATIITANGSGMISGAVTRFHGSSDAGHAYITTMGQSPTGANAGSTLFYDSTAAANGIFTTNGGTGFLAGAGITQFRNSSNAGNATFTNNGSAGSAASGGELDFFDTTTAANATIVNNPPSSIGVGGITQFFNSSKAGTANITNNAAINQPYAAQTIFNAGTSADHATIVNYGSPYVTPYSTSSGHTVFNNGSTADHANLSTTGALAAGGFGGEIDFNAGSDMANATITNNGGAVSGAAGGFTSTNNDSGATADNAKFINNGGTISGAYGGYTNIQSNSTAANATFTTNGGTASGAGGGATYFGGNATAASATLITNGGTNGGAGGITEFIGGGGLTPSGGTARVITNAGGIFDISYTGFLTVGSIEGAGTYQLGGATLTSGSLNTDTTVSGPIVDGGISTGTRTANLVKEGSGKLTLTGPNTYTGATTVNGGTLSTPILADAGSPSGIGAASTTAANLVINGATFQYTGPTTSTNRLFTVTPLGATLDASGSGRVTFSNAGPIGLSGSGPRNLTLTGSNTANNTLGATIADGSGGPTSITKTGSGTWALSALNTFSGPTTITAGTLRYGGSDPGPDYQAYTLNAGNAAGNQNANAALGLDFNVNAGQTITITQLGVYAASNNGTPFTFASSHTAYIYQRNDSNNTGTVLASVNATASVWNAGRPTSDGYRFLPLATPLTLTAGTYMVVAEAFGADKDLNTGIYFGGNAGTFTDGGGRLSSVGASPYGVPGIYPTNPNTFPAYNIEYGAGNFVFNPPPNLTGRILDDVIVNGPTAILDLGANQNGYVGTVTLDGGGSIIGSGTSTLTSRTSFQMKSGSVTAILAGAGIPLVKTTTGTVTLSGANTYSGNTTVSAGTLKFNIASGAATIAAGATATVASGATLELAGSVSALGTAGGHRVHIVNNSAGGAGPSGVVVSGVHQVVGDIDGTGSTQVNAGSDLTADHIIQSALIIGGTAGGPGLVTIAASDASGSPLFASSARLFGSDPNSDGLAVPTSLAPVGLFAANDISTGSLSAARSASEGLAVPAVGKSVGSDSPAPVPEPSTHALALLAVLSVVSAVFIRRTSMISFPLLGKHP